jgi:hypothetical protein
VFPAGWLSVRRLGFTIDAIAELFNREKETSRCRFPHNARARVSFTGLAYLSNKKQVACRETSNLFLYVPLNL